MGVKAAHRLPAANSVAPLHFYSLTLPSLIAIVSVKWIRGKYGGDICPRTFQRRYIYIYGWILLLEFTRFFLIYSKVI
jgi:hypothetical protein